METRLALVEDSPLYRRSLDAVLSLEIGFRMTSSFPSPVPLLEAAREAREGGHPCPWDLVLMDIEMPSMTGIDATRKLKEIFADVCVVMLTVFEQPSSILEAICAGADGYLLKKTPPATLIAQLHDIVAGGSPMTPEVARTVMVLLRDARVSPAGAAASGTASGSEIQLSERELEVLRGLANGLGYKQVADRMHLSVDTVRTYVRRLYRKLQVHNIGEAVQRAVRSGLI